MVRKDGGAVLATTNWTVTGSASQGRAMVESANRTRSRLGQSLQTQCLTALDGRTSTLSKAIALVLSRRGDPHGPSLTGTAIEHRPRQEALAPYARPHVGRSALDLATSVVPYLALSVGMYLLLGVSYPLALVLAAPATGFLLRTYVVFHDCAHGSFLPSKRGNAWLGTALGLLVFAPFVRWRHGRTQSRSR